MATEKENIEPDYRIRTIESLSRHIEAALRYFFYLILLFFCISILNILILIKNCKINEFIIYIKM